MALAWRDRAFKVLLVRWAGVALAMAPAIILFVLSGDAQGGAEAPAAIKGSRPAVVAPMALMTELRTFGAMALAGYYPWINAIFGLYLAVGVLVLMARRRLRFAWIPICTACLLGVVCILFIKMQFLFPNSLLQRRLPAIIVLLLILSIDVPSFGRARLWAIGAGLLLLVVQTVSLSLSFYRYDAEISEVRAAYAVIPPGSKVFCVKPDVLPEIIAKTMPQHQFYAGGLLGLFQLQTLMAAERQIFLPYYFANPEKQPMRLRPGYEAQGYVDGGVATVWSFAEAVRRDPTARPSWLNVPIWRPTRDWPSRYDYLTVVYPDFIPELRGDDTGLAQVFRGRWFAVYRIKAPASP